MKNCACRLLSAVLVAVALVNCSSSASSSPGSAASAAPTAAPPAPAASAGAVPAAGAVAPLAANATIQSEAARIGANPKALLGLVSDGIAYDVYPGAFRGSAATLSDRSGNDVDKTLLLHDLILAAMPQSNLRFAQCTLDSATQDRLVAQWRDGYRAPQMVPAPANDPRLQNSKIAATLRNQVPALWSGLVDQAREQQTKLEGDLRNANVAARYEGPDLHGNVAGHVWLQIEEHGKWTDLDPTLSGGAIGASLCNAASTSPDLPDELYDTVRLAVIVEQKYGGSLSDQTVAQGTWRAASLADASLGVAFAEPSGFAVHSTPAPPGMSVFTPLLRAGSDVISGRPLYLPTLAQPSEGVGSSVSGIGSAAASALGEAPVAKPTSAPADSSASPSPVAAWIQVTLSSPNEPAQVVRETIFDRIAFADRFAQHAASAPLLRLDDGNGHYLPLSTLWSVGIGQGTAFAGAIDPHQLALHANDATAVLDALGIVHRHYGMVRRALFAAVSGSEPAPIAFSQPEVSFLSAVWRPAAGMPSRLSPGLSMDVALDRAVPMTGNGDAATAFAVSSLVAERFTAASSEMLAGIKSGKTVASVPAQDVLATFDQARQANIGLASVQRTSTLSTAVSADAQARLSSSLGDGDAALAPLSMVTVGGQNDYGWWILDRNGALRDEMQNGRHTEEAEYSLLSRIAAKAGLSVRQLGAVVGCVFIVSTFMNASMSEGEERAEAQEQFENTIESEFDVLELIEKSEKAGELTECE